MVCAPSSSFSFMSDAMPCQHVSRRVGVSSSAATVSPVALHNGRQERSLGGMWLGPEEPRVQRVCGWYVLSIPIYSDMISTLMSVFLGTQNDVFKGKSSCSSSKSTTSKDSAAPAEAY
ncbi:hypothetical protein C8R44DRAFT_981790 [Mycena epipterygia]|nr:hypothetical protein C8R44DRAFT_981790 [Mycena epipterygia]